MHVVLLDAAVLVLQPAHPATSACMHHSARVSLLLAHHLLLLLLLICTYFCS
jgi:hypothetical protein